MEKEIWVTCKISDHYEVSSFGRIRSLGFDYMGANGIRIVAYPRVLKTCFNKRSGYMGAVIRLNKKPKSISLHRLVATHFHDNQLNKAEVNHKDGDKLNNRADNLEWVTRSENHKHRFEVLKHTPNCTGLFNRHGSKPINQLSIDGIFIKSYPSVNEAARQLSICRTGISQVLTGRVKTCGGFKWEYKK